MLQSKSPNYSVYVSKQRKTPVFHKVVFINNHTLSIPIRTSWGLPDGANQNAATLFFKMCRVKRTGVLGKENSDTGADTELVGELWHGSITIHTFTYYLFVFVSGLLTVWTDTPVQVSLLNIVLVFVVLFKPMGKVQIQNNNNNKTKQNFKKSHPDSKRR